MLGLPHKAADGLALTAHSDFAVVVLKMADSSSSGAGAGGHELSHKKYVAEAGNQYLEIDADTRTVKVRLGRVPSVTSRSASKV